MEEKTTFMSESIDQITAALSAFQGEVEQPSLNKTNPYFKSRYVDLSGVLKAAQPILAKNGMSVAQLIVGDELVTLLSHKSGQWFKSVCAIGTYKSQQDRGSAITYTKRYAICAILGIAADTDDDGNSATDTDKKSGNIAGAHAAPQQPQNDARLAQALAEVASLTSTAQAAQCWNKWANEAPALCQNGTAFYKAISDKMGELRAKEQQSQTQQSPNK
jgi:hypothetical protein